MKTLILLFLFAFVPAVGATEVFKCVDKEGRKLITDVPCFDTMSVEPDNKPRRPAVYSTASSKRDANFASSSDPLPPAPGMTTWRPGRK